MTDHPVYQSLDGDQAREVVGAIDGLIRQPSAWQFAIRKMTSWVAIPEYSGSHLTHLQRHRITSALLRSGVETMAGCVLEMSAPDLVFQISASEVGLDAVNARAFGLNVALLSHCRRYLLLCTGLDYLLHLGERGVATEAAGVADVGSGLARFEMEARADPTVDVQVFLQAVADKLRDEYPQALPGSWITVPGDRPSTT